ncbi:olfactory receptor 14C36-like [Eudromia elegans]
MSNRSSLNEFLLLAFSETRELQLLHFSLFLAIYLAALLGNGLIITAVACDHHLHIPMYFFLLNLSLLDLGAISTTIPKSMSNSLWDTRTISYSGCAAQMLFIAFFLLAEYFILTVMAYDRFVAICRPLHYGTLLSSRVCVKMAAAAWGTGFLCAVLHTANIFSLSLCQNNVVEQFFCEIAQMLKLSCIGSYFRKSWAVVVTAWLGFGCFIFIVLSYVQIFRAVLRIPSEQGRHKAFSTCFPHLAVVSLFLSTVMFAHLKPPSISQPALDLVLAVMYSVVPPTLNPLIYSLRNKELKDAGRRLTQWFPSTPGPELLQPRCLKAVCRLAMAEQRFLQVLWLRELSREGAIGWSSQQSVVVAVKELLGVEVGSVSEGTSMELWDAGHGRSRGQGVPALPTPETLAIWEGVSNYIVEQLMLNKGVRIIRLGTFSIVTERVSVGKHALVTVRRPVFHHSKNIAQLHGLTYDKA